MHSRVFPHRYIYCHRRPLFFTVKKFSCDGYVVLIRADHFQMMCKSAVFICFKLISFLNGAGVLITLFILVFL